MKIPDRTANPPLKNARKSPAPTPAGEQRAALLEAAARRGYDVNHVVIVGLAAVLERDRNRPIRELLGEQ